MQHITITGRLGSGKSVVSTLLSTILKFEVESVGSFLRKWAQEHGMSTMEFNKYIENHPEFDYELDRYVEAQRENNIPKIFDSRLAWHFIPESFKIYLYVDDTIAAERIYKDKNRINEKYENIGYAKLYINQRRESEKNRFLSQYNLNIEDFSNYNLVIDTSYVSPEMIVEIILHNYNKKNRSNDKNNIWLSPNILIPTQHIRNHPLSKVEMISSFFNKSLDYENEPISLLFCNNKFYIFDGHKRVINAIIKDIKLLPCILITKGDLDLLPFGQLAKEYVAENSNEENVLDWLDLISFIKK